MPSGEPRDEERDVADTISIGSQRRRFELSGKEAEMRFWDTVKRRVQPETTLIEVAEQLAERCFERVWQRVRGHLATLSAAEARGYIRARGILVLRPAVGEAVEQRSFSQAEGAALYALTVQAVSQRVQARCHAVDRTVRRRAA